MTSSVVIQVLIIAALFAVFYLILVRPQRLRLKQHRELLDGLRPGQRVSTVGGLVGTIVESDDPHLVTIEITANIQVSVTRTSIDRLLTSPASASEHHNVDARRAAVA